MRTLKSLLAAVLTVVMIASMGVSAFAAGYDEIDYDDVNDLFGTTLDSVNTIYMKFVDKLGIIPAMGNSFMPEMKITRGEAVKISYRMLHNDFNELDLYAETPTDFDVQGEEGDIKDTSMLKPYLAWAMDYQLINSEYVTDKKFEPEKNITGEEFITLIVKTLGVSTLEDNQATYEEIRDAILEGSEVTVDSETVNREQAAIIVARAMVYDPNGGISEDTFMNFLDFDNKPLASLSTAIYGCATTELSIRATLQQPLNYEVNKDVLLSNGAQISVDADLTSCIGYPIKLVYMDVDQSGTFTENEKLITYELGSPLVAQFALPDLNFFGHSYFVGTSEAGTYYVYPQATMYLNGDVWPDSDLYKLNRLVDQPSYTSAAGAIAGRPNLTFTFLQSGMSNVDLVFAEEWIPGKVLASTENYISIFDYYTHATLTYDDDDVVYHQLTNLEAGDYVNFYVSNGKLNLSAGTTMVLDTYTIADDGVLSGEISTVVEVENEETGEIVEETKTEKVSYSKHLYVNQSDRPADQIEGSIVAVLDSTGTTYIAIEELLVTEETAVQIVSSVINAEGTVATIVAREIASGEEVNLTVDTDRISTATGTIDPGAYFTYAENEAGKVNLYGVDMLYMTAIESEDYFIVGNEQKYLKAEDYTDDSEAPIASTVMLVIDRNNVVWAAYTAI